MSVILSVYPDQIYSNVKYFSKIVIFLDKYGLVKTYNLMSAQKTVLTLGAVLNDTTGHRMILPPGDANFNIPYKIMDFWHREKLCLGSFLLARQVNLKYFVFSVNRISNSVTHNCFSCLKKRKQKEKKYFQQCNTSRPFLFDIDRNINSLMINSNDCWQLDLLVQVRLFMDFLGWLV